MSLDKSIRSGRERRKPYRGSAKFDSSCRPGGACGVCLGDRMYRSKREAVRTMSDMHEYSIRES